MSSPKLRLPEYDFAWNLVIGRAINGFVASHELLGKIRQHADQHRGPIRNVRGPEPLDMALRRTECTATIQIEDVRNANIDAHTSFVSELATAQVSSMAKMFFHAAGQVSDAAGTTRDAKGKPPSWDLILDMLEEMPISFDEDGKANLPTLVAPGTAAELPAQTEVQRVRQAQIIQRKEAEHAATKRTRRLPR